MLKLQNRINWISRKYLEKEYSSKLNVDTFPHLGRYAVNKILKDEPLAEQYLKYLFNQWVQSAFVNNRSFFNKALKLIKRHKFSLSQMDKHDINLLEERIFSSERHIKILMVDFDLRKGEQAGVKFENCSLFIKKDKLELIKKGTLALTNKRVIIKAESEDKSFFWGKILSINYSKFGFEFNYNDMVYLLRIHDQISLNNTIENFRKKKLR